jgi:hypothetical protein
VPKGDILRCGRISGQFAIRPREHFRSHSRAGWGGGQNSFAARKRKSPRKFAVKY